MTEKEFFIENMKKRTKKFAVDVISKIVTKARDSTYGNKK